MLKRIIIFAFAVLLSSCANENNTQKEDDALYIETLAEVLKTKSEVKETPTIIDSPVTMHAVKVIAIDPPHSLRSHPVYVVKRISSPNLFLLICIDMNVKLKKEEVLIVYTHNLEVSGTSIDSALYRGQRLKEAYVYSSLSWSDFDPTTK